MKKLTFTLMATVMSSIIVFSACSKEGPAGPAGATGAQGPAGSAGSQGPAGTANVIYSAWLTPTFDSLFTPAGDFAACEADIPATKLDAAIINSGEMKVYVDVGEDAPFVFPIPYNDGLTYIDVGFEIGHIYLSSNRNLTGIPFRYILVPGGVTARKAGPTVDWKNYESVKSYLQLTD